MQEIENSRTVSAIRHSRAAKIANDFKAFILRGNVVDLAVGIIIGAAFTGIVTSLVNDVFLAFIAAIFGKSSFSSLVWVVGSGQVKWGNLLSAIVNFLIVAAVIFFLVVQPVNFLVARRKQEPPPDPTTRDCPFCLSNVPIKATRCAYCTSELPPAPAVAVPVDSRGSTTQA